MDHLSKICALFEHHLGFNTHYLSEATWEKAVSERMRACHISDYKQYYTLLATDNAEFQELIEIIVVPETWFFRDSASIYSLVSWIKGLASRPGAYMARILSVPCSSGEEPYSISMALHEAEVSNANYMIEGVDISQRLIDRALSGVYGKNSFRSIEDRYFNNYFDKKNDLYHLKPIIRSQVYLKKGNVFEKELFQSKTTFDAIFCRNLLIYLHSEGQKKLLGIIKKLLKTNGRLYVAPSELEIARQYGFQIIGEPKDCALGFGSPKEPEIWHNPAGSKAGSLAKALKKISIFNDLPQSQESPIKQAMEFADEGKFDLARGICQEYLTDNKEDPEAYYLLGVIAHAQEKEAEAESYFKKAAYLNPQHHEALVYLALLMEKKGDLPNSKIYHDRAQRCLILNHNGKD